HTASPAGPVARQHAREVPPRGAAAARRGGGGRSIDGGPAADGEARGRCTRRRDADPAGRSRSIVGGGSRRRTGRAGGRRARTAVVAVPHAPDAKSAIR